ncbi:unnamed protein product [Oppiella nova]|uniref:Uncharacterized protein n=1 Tax=Oppiella nova TaxID=334625 RepID=A0A7R9QV56_9ACAR|nr:unnamed protein product [Oppiella nova]CAG2175528.1 unnamed protein product [Oppiella nova]
MDSRYVDHLKLVPDHWCAVQELANFSHGEQHRFVRPVVRHSNNTDDVVRDSCHMFDVDYRQVLNDLRLPQVNASVKCHKSKLSVKKCSDGWVYDRSYYWDSFSMHILFNEILWFLVKIPAILITWPTYHQKPTIEILVIIVWITLKHIIYYDNIPPNYRVQSNDIQDNYDKHWLYLVVVSSVTFMTSFLATFLMETLRENMPQNVTSAEKLLNDMKYWKLGKRKCDLKSNIFKSLSTWDLNELEGLDNT